MSYIKNAFCNHIYLIGVINNSNVDDYADIIGGAVTAADGTEYYIDDVIIFDGGRRPYISVIISDQDGHYTYDLMTGAAFADIVKKAMTVELPAVI